MRLPLSAALVFVVLADLPLVGAEPAVTPPVAKPPLVSPPQPVPPEKVRPAKDRLPPNEALCRHGSRGIAAAICERHVNEVSPPPLLRAAIEALFKKAGMEVPKSVQARVNDVAGEGPNGHVKMLADIRKECSPPARTSRIIRMWMSPCGQCSRSSTSAPSMSIRKRLRGCCAKTVESAAAGRGCKDGQGKRRLQGGGHCQG